MFRALLMVGLGGALGSMSRYAITYLTGRVWSSPFPLATFLINVIGCFIIGLLWGIAQKHQWMQGPLWLLLATGFCGGFTTFSTFALENLGLFSKQQSLTSFVYIIFSVVVGLALCKAGTLVVR
jgi:fluoride exporter